MASRLRRVVVPGVCALIVCLLTVVSQASEMLETGDFGVVRAKAIELGKQHGPENVLLVFDLDNTLLAANQPLGSDQWYDWQSAEMKKPQKPSRLVAQDPEGLLEAQGIIYALSHMHPPEKGQPAIVQELQARGFRTLVLTSRGFQFRDATMRHLRECGYDFAGSAPKVMDEFRGVVQPYSLRDVAAAGISQEEVERCGLKSPREASYDQGVFMTAGQNKGAMLLVFLAHCPRHFSAVLFVDDKKDNTKRVFSALVERDIEVVTCRYSAEDDEVAAFSDQEKQEAAKDWKELQGVISRLFKRKCGKTAQ